MLTGYLLQVMSLCELRGLWEASEPRPPPPARAYAARKVASLLVGSCGRLYCLRRERLEGSVLGVPYVSVPDAFLADRDGHARAVLRLRVREDARPREYDYKRLYLDAYALIDHGLADESIILAVLAARDQESLLRGLRWMLEEWRGEAVMREGFTVSTRVYPAEEAARAILRAAAVLRGEVKPRPRPGRACEFCPFRGSCPAAPKI